MSEPSEERDPFVLYIVLATIILVSTLIAVKLNENEKFATIKGTRQRRKSPDEPFSSKRKLERMKIASTTPRLAFAGRRLKTVSMPKFKSFMEH